MQKYKKFVDKLILVASIIFFAVSMLPIIYCSFFDYATGDDLQSGAFVKRAIVEKGGIGEPVKAFLEWMRFDYTGWDGNWATSILWGIEPSIWGEKVYIVTVYLALISIMGGTLYCARYFLKKYLQCSGYYISIIWIAVSFFMIQYMPKPRVIFWYTGMVQYFIPFGLFLTLMVLLDRYLSDGNRSIFFFILWFTLHISGAGYLTTVLTFEVYVLLIVYNLIKNPNKKRVVMLLIPFVLLIIGFTICAISPGIAKRSGNGLGFSVGRVTETLTGCFKRALSDISAYFNNRILFSCVPLCAIFTWYNIDSDKSRIKFRYPLLAVLFLFCIYASTYAPEIYANDDVSGGVPDTYWMTFVIIYFIAIIYLTGYIKKLAKKRGILYKNVGSYIRGMLLITGGILVLTGIKPAVKDSLGYLCYDFISSGRLKDFDRQMKQRFEILYDDSVEDAVLPYMNDEQGPFMHMAVVKDPNAYTCTVTASFYGKNSVRAIPREEWNEMYGNTPGEQK